MIKNNIEKDIKIKCVEADTTQAALAEKIGKTVQYVNRIVKKDDGVVNKTFIQMMEGLGYDIRLIYEKREDTDNEETAIGFYNLAVSKSNAFQDRSK